jgi:rfaE bifunctional protein kinase chain/domain
VIHSRTEIIAPDWNEVVAALFGRRILVVGDVMLDDYISGDARRVCPEAPVPVIETSRRWCVPGGAGNAAANVAALGGRAVLGGVTGEDFAASELTKATRAAGVDPSGFVQDNTRPTTTKLRVLARGQQVTRVDTESTETLPSGSASQLARWAERMVAESDAVLLSDYGKGAIDGFIAGRVIAAAQKEGRPVVVDPKGTNVGRYRGATVVKPNLGELRDLSGRPASTPSEVMEAGHGVAQEMPGTAVLVTRGGDGMALFRAGTAAMVLPAAPARRVYDVTGAGDTAAAALALALGAGLTIELAARVANAAAGLAVCKVGTAVVKPDELLATLLEAAPDFVPFTV